MSDRESQSNANPHTNPEPAVGPWEVTKSVLAAFFGVQSEKNRARDFTHGKMHHFVIAGVILTVLFVVLVYTVVQLVLAAAGVP
ncbi:MAG: DUF2970 domain-containing protein [Candidatus Competibacterales bacterium]